MDNKKKCGKAYFSLLLGCLFIVLFGMFSECFALTPINDFSITDFENLIDYNISLCNNLSDTSDATKYKGYWNALKNNSTRLNTAFNTLKNTYVKSMVDYVEQLSFYNYNGQSILIFANNNTIGNSLPHWKIVESHYFSTTYQLILNCIDDNGNIITSPSNKVCMFSVSSNNQYFQFYTVGSGGVSSSQLKNYIIKDLNNDVYNLTMIGNFYRPGNFLIQLVDSSTSNYGWCSNDNVVSLIQPEPEPEPSGDLSGDILPGGTITNPSGEITGKVDLTKIENGINNINQNLNSIENKIPTSGDMQLILSGETSKITGVLTDSADDLIDNTTITSGDIEDALGFNFMADPYDNFWFEMTTGLGNALTNSVRKLPVDWLGYNGFFDLDVNGFSYPAPLENILTTVSTVCMVWILVKWWKIIIDKLTSGNVDEVLAMNEEERNC